MMIQTLKPYGSINQNSLLYKCEQNGKFYLIDKAFNRFEIAENIYQNIDLPVKERKVC